MFARKSTLIRKPEVCTWKFYISDVELHVQRQISTLLWKARNLTPEERTVFIGTVYNRFTTFRRPLQKYAPNWFARRLDYLALFLWLAMRSNYVPEVDEARAMCEEMGLNPDCDSITIRQGIAKLSRCSQIASIDRIFNSPNFSSVDRYAWRLPKEEVWPLKEFYDAEWKEGTDNV